MLDTIRSFVHQHTGHPVGDDEDLFATGYVNSLFAIQIVMFVEQKLDIPVAGEDLDLANFRSISDIHGFAQRYAVQPV